MPQPDQLRARAAEFDRERRDPGVIAAVTYDHIGLKDGKDACHPAYRREIDVTHVQFMHRDPARTGRWRDLRFRRGDECDRVTARNHARAFVEGADFLAAHNARFDRAVLGACCAMASLPAPRLPFVCTVDLARNQWGLRPTKLPDVCRYLGLELNHHNAASDAEACARIVMAAVVENPRCLCPFGV